MEDAAGSSFWAIATILGPVVLAAALLFGTMRYRRRRAGRSGAARSDTDTPRR